MGAQNCRPLIAASGELKLPCRQWSFCYYPNTRTSGIRPKIRNEGELMKRSFQRSIFAAAMLSTVGGLVNADISYTGGTYSQDFNTLVSTGTNQPWTNNSTLPGWYLFQSAGSPITAYSSGTGSSNTGNFYSFGSVSSTERALGGVASGAAYFGSPAAGAVAGHIAVCFTNQTGNTLDSFTVSFSGEQWRDGGSATPAAQSMVLEYGFGSSFGTVSSWIVPGGTFDWTSPVFTNTGSGAAVDGNAAGLVTGVGGTISSLTWNPGDSLWIRWIERNDVGNDHGLAIDNFSFSADAIPEPGTLSFLGLGLLAFAGMGRRR